VKYYVIERRQEAKLESLKSGATIRKAERSVLEADEVIC